MVWVVRSRACCTVVSQPCILWKGGKCVNEFFSIFRGTAGSSHPLRVKDHLLWGALGCCFIFPFLSGTHGKVFEG